MSDNGVKIVAKYAKDLKRGDVITHYLGSNWPIVWVEPDAVPHAMKVCFDRPLCEGGSPVTYFNKSTTLEIAPVDAAWLERYQRVGEFSVADMRKHALGGLRRRLWAAENGGFANEAPFLRAEIERIEATRAA